MIDLRGAHAELLADEVRERQEFANPRAHLTFWTKDLKVWGYGSDHRELKFSAIKNKPGGMTLLLPDDEHYSEYFAGQHRNTARPISVDLPGWRTLWLVTSFKRVRKGFNRWWEITAVDALQYLAAMRLWPCPWFPAEFQPLHYWYGVGPAPSMMAAAALANFVRLQANLWSWPQANNLFAFIPDLGNALWPLMVNPRRKFLQDTSKWTTSTWRMDEALTAFQEVCAAEDIQITYQFFIPWLDEQPFPEFMHLDRPCVIFDFVEKGAPRGMTGTILDGIIRTGLDMADGAFEWITYPILDTDSYNAYLDPLRESLGMLPARPLALYTTGDWSPAESFEQTGFVSLASRITAGGKSPDWVNALAVNGANLALGLIGGAFGLPGLQLGALESLVKNKIMAFHSMEDGNRVLTGGPMRFREAFAESASTGLSLNTLAGMKTAHWVTRDYETHSIEVANGYPYFVGRHIDLGDPVAVEKPGGVVDVDALDQIDYEESRSAHGKLVLHIGSPPPKEPGAAALAKVRQTAGWLHRVALSE